MTARQHARTAQMSARYLCGRIHVGKSDLQVLRAFYAGIYLDVWKRTPRRVRKIYLRGVRYGLKWELRPDECKEHLKRAMWRMMSERLQFRNIMSTKKWREWSDTMDRGELPEITENNLLNFGLSLQENVAEFMRDALKEVWDLIRPRTNNDSTVWPREFKGAKTNRKFQQELGDKAILAYWAEPPWCKGGAVLFSYRRHQEAIILDNAFALLAGIPFSKDYETPLLAALENTKTGEAETDMFRVKLFQNGNAHVWFKRMDLVRRLNGMFAGNTIASQPGS